MIEINLLPGGGRKAGIRGAATMDVSAAFAGIAERFRDVYLAVAVLAVLAAGAGGFLMFRGQAERREALAERERRAVLDSTRYATVLRARRKAEAERDSVQRQLTIIKSIDDHRFIWPHLLEEVSRAVPAYTWLTSIAQVSAPPNAALADVEPQPRKEKPDTSKAAREKAKARADSILLAAQAGIRFRIVGQTVDLQALTQFMRALESSPYVRNVQLSRSDLVQSTDGKEITEFQVEADSERPPSAYTRLSPNTVRAR